VISLCRRSRLIIRARFELAADVDLRGAFWDLAGEPQKTVQADVAFRLGFQPFKMDTPYVSMCHHAPGDAGGQCLEQVINRIGTPVRSGQKQAEVAIWACLD